MTTPFPVGSIITHKGLDYCVLSSKKVAHGWQVTAILANGDKGWWYGFYFPSRDPLPQTNARANFQEGGQGEGEHHV